MPDEAAAMATMLGGEPDQHVGRQLTVELVDNADVVIALAREHRRAVAVLSAKATRKTFTLLELERILVGLRTRQTETPPESGDFAAWIECAARYRGFFYAAPDADNVEDPYRRSASTYERSAKVIADSVNNIVEALTQQTHRAVRDAGVGD
jgi:protein-tyrosine phosphatase